LVDRLLLGLLANGHLLLEGVPGLAKTLTVKTMAAAIQTGFQRLQFTPDLLPADLVGTLIYKPRTGEFTTKLGPIFSNLFWPMRSIARRPKVRARCWKRCRNGRSQSGTKLIRSRSVFWFSPLKTQFEQEGTINCLRRNSIRFMFKLNVGYPQKREERSILDLMATSRLTCE